MYQLDGFPIIQRLLKQGRFSGCSKIGANVLQRCFMGMTVPVHFRWTNVWYLIHPSHMTGAAVPVMFPVGTWSQVSSNVMIT